MPILLIFSSPSIVRHHYFFIVRRVVDSTVDVSNLAWGFFCSELGEWPIGSEGELKEEDQPQQQQGSNTWMNRVNRLESMEHQRATRSMDSMMMISMSLPFVRAFHFHPSPASNPQLPRSFTHSTNFQPPSPPTNPRCNGWFGFWIYSILSIFYIHYYFVKRWRRDSVSHFSTSEAVARCSSDWSHCRDRAPNRISKTMFPSSRFFVNAPRVWIVWLCIMYKKLIEKVFGFFENRSF